MCVCDVLFSRHFDVNHLIRYVTGNSLTVHVRVKVCYKCQKNIETEDLVFFLPCSWKRKHFSFPSKSFLVRSNGRKMDIKCGLMLRNATTKALSFFLLPKADGAGSTAKNKSQ